MLEHLGAVVASIGLLLNLVGSAVIITRAMSKLEITLLKAIADERKEIDAAIDIQARNVGEALSAVRQKIHEVEVWARDTFVRRDGFYKVKDELSAEMKEIAQQLNRRLDTLDAKIDKRGA